MSSYWFSMLVMMALLFTFLGYLNMQFLMMDDLFLSVSVLVDYYSLFFLMLVVFISLMVFVYSRFYMLEKMNVSFYFLVFSFVVSMLILIMSGSLFFVFIGWEGLGVTSFLLIVFYQNWQSQGGASLTVLTNRLGDVIFIIVFFYLFFMGKGLMFTTTMFLLLIFIAFTKSAQWPFSSWLPAAMAAPTPVSSLVHSSTLVTAGIWLIIRFNLELQLSFFPFFILGYFTLLAASLSAFLETDMKKLVALSTLSQLGLMVISLFLGGKATCFFHLMAHAFAKAGLFLIIGSIISSGFSSQNWRENSVEKSYLVFFLMMIFMISLSGLVFSTGFFSKEVILSFFLKKTKSLLLSVMILLVAAPTFGYCFKLLNSLSCYNNSKLINLELSFSFTYPIFFLSIVSSVFLYFLMMNFNFFLMLSFIKISFFSCLAFSLYFIFLGSSWFYYLSEISISVNKILLFEKVALLFEKVIEFSQTSHFSKMSSNFSMKNFLIIILSMSVLLSIWYYNKIVF